MASMQTTEMIYVSVYIQTFTIEYKEARQSQPSPFHVFPGSAMKPEEVATYKAELAAEAAVRTWSKSKMDAAILAKEAKAQECE